MGALYIKDDETYQLAKQLAAQRGISKTAAVKQALQHELAKGEPAAATDQRPLRDRMRDFWQRHPLPAELGPVPDKAFYDDLSGGL